MCEFNANERGKVSMHGTQLCCWGRVGLLVYIPTCLNQLENHHQAKRKVLLKFLKKKFFFFSKVPEALGALQCVCLHFV